MESTVNVEGKNELCSIALRWQRFRVNLTHHLRPDENLAVQIHPTGGSHNTPRFSPIRTCLALA